MKRAIVIILFAVVIGSLAARAQNIPGRCVSGCGPAPGPSPSPSPTYDYEAERQRQLELERQRQEAERQRQREIEDQQRREAEAARQRQLEFERKKQEAMGSMKGIAEGEFGLKDTGGSAPGLKDTGDTSGGLGLKGVGGSVPPPPPPASTRRFSLSQVTVRGDVYILTADGRKLRGQDMALTPITNGASIVTGPQSRMSCTLPDGTVFTVGANSNMVIDEFVYDPDSYSSVRTIRARVELGVFRWVTGKTSRKDPANMKVTLPAGYTGIRGTDLEVLVTSDKSASLRLYTGEVDYTDKRTGATVVLTAGYSLRIASDGSFGKPVRLPPAPKPAPSGR